MPKTLQLGELEPNITVSVNRERGGLNLAMGHHPGHETAHEPLPGAGDGVLASPVWTVAGWRVQFVRLAPGTTLGFDASAARVYAKVIEGALTDRPFRPFPEVGQFADTRAAEGRIAAGGAGALVCIFTETDAVADNIRDMKELEFHGPLADALRWLSFEEKFGGFTDFFNGQDAHMVFGFHLLDDEGAEIAYVHFWTAGKGVNLSTHNHGNTPSAQAPAFAEVHWVLNNGTGAGGMYRCASPDSEEREHWPMQRGQEHGPFFDFDAATGRPKLRENGAVSYPWHGWQAGTDGEPGQAYDFVAAFEINPDYVRI